MNLPWADHDVANVAQVDPRRYQTTDMAWFDSRSARSGPWPGVDSATTTASDQLALPGLAPGPRTTSSAMPGTSGGRGMLMRDVVEFTQPPPVPGRDRRRTFAGHPAKWIQFDDWLKDARRRGLPASQGDHSQLGVRRVPLGDPAQQLRDRVYVVFWRMSTAPPTGTSGCPACWVRPAMAATWSRASTPARPGRVRPVKYEYPRRASTSTRRPKTPCREQISRMHTSYTADAIIN